MQKASLALSAMLFLVANSDGLAQTDDGLQRVAVAVTGLCRGGTAEGSYREYEIAQQGPAKTVQVDGQQGDRLEFQFSAGEWSGIEALAAKQSDHAAYLRCVELMTPIFLTKLPAEQDRTFIDGIDIWPQTMTYDDDQKPQYETMFRISNISGKHLAGLRVELSIHKGDFKTRTFFVRGGQCGISEDFGVLVRIDCNFLGIDGWIDFTVESKAGEDAPEGTIRVGNETGSIAPFEFHGTEYYARRVR